MADSVFNIERLNSSNYGTWVSDIKVILMDRGCWRIIQGEEQEPKSAKDEAVSLKLLQDFRTRFDRAYTTLYLNIEPQYRTIIEDLNSGAEAWKVLEKHFRPDSRARVMGLLDEFYACRIQDDEIGIYASRLKRIISQQKGAAHPVDGFNQSFQVLRFLPPEYEGIVQTIYRWPDNKFKFDKVLEELLAEESRLKQRQEDHLRSLI